MSGRAPAPPGPAKVRSVMLWGPIGSYDHDPRHERPHHVLRLQQFDTDGEAPLLSDKELRQRWAAFHDSIHMASGNWFRRTLGRMLGENTRRYKLARFFGRPLLKVVRSLTGREKDATPQEVLAVTRAPKGSTFPLNYHPQPLAALNLELRGDAHFDDVTIQVLDVATDWSAEAVAALNSTLDSMTTTWLALVDDTTSMFEREAAITVLLAHADESDDVVFADEAGPNPPAPILKPANVGPHTLLSYNLVGRPMLMRVATLRAAGGFSIDAGRAIEHDAFLRLSEAQAQFHHVAAVLPAGRSAAWFSELVNDDTCRVVERALQRRGWAGEVEAHSVPGVVRWSLRAPTPPPSIDIIIPTRDRLDLVRQCLDAIEAITTYPNYRVMILDNDSVDPAALEFFATTEHRVVPCPGPFNYAHIVNRGIQHSSADFVVTLNNDTIVITPDWLEQMVALASLPDVSIVGACLLDQDGRFEHESIVIAPYPQHLRSDSNYTNRDQFVAATRDVAAVTGAVQMVRRELWMSLGGMDEQLKVVMNDVDICLRSQLDGHYVLYTPDVRLYHHVSSSRGTLDPLDDRNRFIRRWDIFGTFRDPYFPESLLLLGETMYYRHR